MAFTDEEIVALSKKGYSAQQIHDAELRDSQDQAQAAAPSFVENATGGQGGFLSKAGTVAGDVWDTVKTALTPEFVRSSDYFNRGFAALKSKDPSAINDIINEGAPGYYDAMAHPLEKALPMGMAEVIPGTRTAESAGFDALSGNTQSWGDYGNSFRKELVGGAIGLAGAGAAYGIGKFNGNRAARAAAMDASINDPVSQAALRYADNAGMLDGESARTALGKGNFTRRDILKGVAEGQDQAIQLKEDMPNDPVTGARRDALVANAFGAPESQAIGSDISALEAQKTGTIAVDTGIFHTGDKANFNPNTGKFDGFTGDVSSGATERPTSVGRVIDKSNLAIATTMEAREQLANNLDLGMAAVNAKAPGTIKGFSFGRDIKPELGQLEKMIADRRMYVTSDPMAAGMQKAINDVQTSFESLRDSTAENSAFRKDMRPSQAITLIKDMNAVRRSLGEFDAAAKANNIRDNRNTFAGRAAELHGIQQIQEALQGLVEDKAAEIIRAVPGLSDAYLPTKQLLAGVNENSLSTMNQISHNMINMRQLAEENLMMTQTAGVNKPTSTFIGTAQQKASIPTSTTGALKAGANALVERFNPPETTPGAARAELARIRYTSPIDQVVDGLMLRDRPVPLLSRDWEQVKMSRDATTELANRATFLGMIAPGTFGSLPEVAQKGIHKQVTLMMPQNMEPVPGGYDIWNHMFTNPFQQEDHSREALKQPLDVQAKVMSAMYDGNKYVPIEPEKPQQPPLPPQVSLDQLNQRLAPALAPSTAPALDFSYDNSISSMIDEFNKSKALHDLN